MRSSRRPNAGVRDGCPRSRFRGRLVAWAAPLAVDGFDAASALDALAGPAGRGYAIEKCEGAPTGAERVWTRAWIGAGPFEVLRVARGRAYSESGGSRRELAGNPFEALGRRLAEFRARRRAGVPAFAGGAVGWLGYEMVHHLEDIPRRPGRSEDACLMFFDGSVVHDRASGRTEAVFWLPEGPGLARARRQAARRAEEIERRLSIPALRRASPASTGGAARGALGRAGFLKAVRRIKEHIRAGDMFQCVLSERFRVRGKVDPGAVYRRLRETEPCPYLFLVRDGASSLVGASPERLVRVDGGVARLCPIAGTRPRGADPAADRLLEAALRRSPKERAEHLMLVDLGRNDLGRVCAPGTVRVASFMRTRRFSRVMHLVSEIEGRLDRGRTAWDALAAAFPAGTVSGAPKVRAMEILSGLEPFARGFYSGAILQADFLGDLDSCIAIRTLRLDADGSVLQAGAGIVADSDPAREYREVLHKLSAAKKALQEAARA